MRAARWSAVVAAVLFLAGCGQTHHYAMLHLTAQDLHLNLNRKYSGGGHAVVRPGQQIAITLPSNPSSGYHWTYLISPNVGSVTFVSHTCAAPATSRPGASGEETWRFKALRKSDIGVGIDFSYWRGERRKGLPAGYVSVLVNVG